MNTTESLLYDMARWMKQVDDICSLKPWTPKTHQLWLAEGRRLREQADQMVGFPRGVR